MIQIDELTFKVSPYEYDISTSYLKKRNIPFYGGYQYSVHPNILIFINKIHAMEFKLLFFNIKD